MKVSRKRLICRRCGCGFFQDSYESHQACPWVCVACLTSLILSEEDARKLEATFVSDTEAALEISRVIEHIY